MRKKKHPLEGGDAPNASATLPPTCSKVRRDKHEIKRKRDSGEVGKEVMKAGGKGLRIKTPPRFQVERFCAAMPLISVSAVMDGPRCGGGAAVATRLFRVRHRGEFSRNIFTLDAK